MALDMDLAKRLKTYRTFKNLTQKEVAAHLNVPHSAISDIANRSSVPVQARYSKRTFEGKGVHDYVRKRSALRD